MLGVTRECSTKERDRGKHLPDPLYHPDSKVDVHHERTVETLLGPTESEDSRDHVGLTTWQVRYT